jgi:DNA-binding NarL/FixJ family response regulator
MTRRSFTAVGSVVTARAFLIGLGYSFGRRRVRVVPPVGEFLPPVGLLPDRPWSSRGGTASPARGTTRCLKIAYCGEVAQRPDPKHDPSAEPISVLIVDDDEIVRVGLRMILSGASDITVTAEASGGRGAVELAADLDPDVILMDIRMGDMDGIEATRLITAGSSRAKVVILTTFDVRDHVYEALRAGASGFLVKRTAPDELLHAVRSAAAGDALLSPSVTRMILEQFTAPSPETSSPELERLTPRELDVLVEVAHGYSNSEIAERLSVAESTIKTHLKRVLLKLDVRDRVQAVVFAYDNGLVSPGDTNVSRQE